MTSGSTPRLFRSVKRKTTGLPMVQRQLHLGEGLLPQLALRGDHPNVARELLGVEQPPVRGERQGGGVVGLDDELGLHAERVPAGATGRD